MDCPRDKREMEHQGYHKYPRHACPDCKGVFVLERDLTERVGAGGKKLAAVAEVKLDNVKDSPLACPRDGATMKAVFFGDAEIDVCASCHGLWLDRGEYEKIVARMREKRDAVRPNPKFAKEAPEVSSPAASLDNVLTLLGGALGSALTWARILERSARRGRIPEPVGISIPDIPVNPNCRK